MARARIAPVRRALALPLGVAAYLLSVGPMVWLVGFLANAPLPRTVDGPPFVPAGEALAVDLALLVSFGFVHSLLARDRVKRAMATAIPAELERSVYSIVAGLQIVAVLVGWRALPESVWQVEAPAVRIALWLLFAAGWAIVVAALHAVGSFRLFGLAAAWSLFRGVPDVAPPLALRGPYRWVRHPLYTGTILALFAAPDMSRGHLLLAVVFTAYILLGMRFEERDLARQHGAAWLEYRNAVPALLPRLPGFRAGAG